MPPSTFPPLDDAWLKQVAAPPAKEQVEAVKAELMKRNPDFDGDVKATIKGGKVTDLNVRTDKLTDISPVRAFTGLEILRCGGQGPGAKSRFADLSPLRGMKLTAITSFYNPVSDLSPLKDMKLTR